MVEWGFWEWRGQWRGDGKVRGFRLPPEWLEEWCLGQGFPPSQCPSEKFPKGILWGMALVVVVGTSKDFEWVVEQWWKTITMIASVRRTLIFCYA